MSIDATSRPPQISPLLFMSSEQIAAELGGDVNASVAAMLLLHAKQMRESVQTARRFEEENLRIQEESQVRAMHEQADRIRDAGTNEGIGLMVSAGFQIGSGIVGLSGPTLGSGELKPGAAGTQTILQGVGNAANAGGKLLATRGRHAGDMASADATTAEQRTEAAKRRLDELDDQAADTRELVNEVIDFLREQTRTKANTDNSAASIRG